MVDTTVVISARHESDASRGEILRSVDFIGAQLRLTDNLRRIDGEELQRVLSCVEIHGSGFGGRPLQVSDLTRLGMEPNYHFTVGGRDIYLAGQLYPLANGRVGIVAYVQDESRREVGKPIFTVRSYYRSNSQGGSWRFLPEVFVQGKKIVWYSKGYGEESLAVPSETLEAIQQVRLRGGVARGISPDDCSLLFAGPARHILTPFKMDNDEGCTYQGVTARAGVRLNEDTWTANPLNNALTPPGLARISDPICAPVLDRCHRSFAIESPINSDGIPEQIIARADPTDDEPEIYPLERIEVANGCILTKLPNGLVLVFSTRKDAPYELQAMVDAGGREYSLAEGGDCDFVLQDQRVGERPLRMNELKVLVEFNEARNLDRLVFDDGTVYEMIQGVMDVKCFHSEGTPKGVQDRLEYLFATDRMRHTMIPSIVVTGPVNQLGLRSHWVTSRSFMAPLFEYPQLASGYGDPKYMRWGYLSLWANYLSKIPLIREFHRRYVGGELPSEVIDGADFRDSPVRLPAAPVSSRVVSKRADVAFGDISFVVGFERNGDMVFTIKGENRTICLQSRYLQTHHNLFLSNPLGLLDVGGYGRHGVLGRIDVTFQHEDGQIRSVHAKMVNLSEERCVVDGVRVSRNEAIDLIARGGKAR